MDKSRRDDGYQGRNGHHHRTRVAGYRSDDAELDGAGATTPAPPCPAQHPARQRPRGQGIRASIERDQQAVGRAPLAVVADRGFSHPRIFEWNARRGIAGVFPYRRRTHNAPPTPPATDRWDEQGVTFCKHCGGGTNFVKFHVDRGQPRIWYRCALPQTPDCLKDESINCKADSPARFPSGRSTRPTRPSALGRTTPPSRPVGAVSAPNRVVWM